MDDSLVFTELGDEFLDTVLVEESDLFRGFRALVLELDGEARVEEGEFAQAGGEAVELELDGIDEDGGVREKGDVGAGFLRDQPHR